MGSCRDIAGTSLWFILRQIKAEDGQSKILNIENVRFCVGAPHEVASEVYDRYLRIYKTLYADIERVNSKFIRRFRTVGNFFIKSHQGIGFIKMGKNYYHPMDEAVDASGLDFEDYKVVVASAVRSRNELMKKKNFQKLNGEARTLKILTEEMRGVLNGKTRISRQQGYRTAKCTTIDRNVVSYNGIGNQ
jgi:hypothetical protein